MNKYISIPLLILFLFFVGMLIWYMARPSTAKLQKQCRETLAKFQAACRDADVPYFAHYGTMLGAVRDGGMIEWDDDIDVGVLSDDFLKLEPVLSSYSLVVKSHLPIMGNIRKNRRFVKVCDAHQKGTEKILSAVDVFLYERDGQSDIIYSTTKDRPAITTMNWEDVSKLREIRFDDMTIHVPSNAEKYLAERYGENWRVPKRHFSHYSLFQTIVFLVFFVLLLLVFASSTIWCWVKKKC